MTDHTPLFDLCQDPEGDAAIDALRDPSALLSPSILLPVDDVRNALKRNEVGDAELFAKTYANRIVYDFSEKRWHLWNGYHWEADNRLRISKLLYDSLVRHYQSYAEQMRVRFGDDDEDGKSSKSGISAHIKSLLGKKRIDQVLDLASRQPGLSLQGDEWDSDPWLLGVANGLLDLKSGAFRPAQPQDYIRTVAPTRWRGLHAPAVRWEQFLREVFAGDNELIKFIQRLLGYALTGWSVEHILAIFWGLDGRNGKDTLLAVLKHLLGPLAKPIVAEVLLDSSRNPNAATPHLHSLRGVRLAWVNESGEQNRLNEAQIKMLTGGGRLVARPLYGAPVDFEPQHLLILMTNYLPHADASDAAFWERIRVIPFTQRFVDEPQAPNEHPRDRYLAKALENEASGILAWLVRGCLEWKKVGLEPPKGVRRATEQYLRQEDDLADFIEEVCVISEDASVKARQLYESYEAWAESHGREVMSETKFGRVIGKKFRREESREARIYRGIGLRS